MNKAITIGSKEHFYKPLKKLLLMGNQIHKQYANTTNDNLTDFLSVIPTIDPNKIDSFLSNINNANLISKFNSLGINTDFDFFSLKQFPTLANYLNIKEVLVYYYSIYWAIDPLNNKDFSAILSILQTAKDDSQIHDLTIHNCCFELILSKSISSTTDIQIYHSIIPYFLQYILTLPDLPDTSFSIIVALFGIVDDFGNEYEKSLLCDTIAHIFRCNFSFLTDHNYSSLLNCLKIDINNLNVKIVRVLSIVSQNVNATLYLMDIIHKLYTQLYQLINNSMPIEKLQTTSQNPVLNFQTNKPKKIHDFLFLKRNGPFQFVQLPLSSVSFEIIEKPSLLPQSIYSKVVQLSDFLMNSTNQIVLDFIAQFSVMFGEENHFFEICYAFLSILIHLCDVTTLDTGIELLSQSPLFSSSLSIFDNEQLFLDPKINFLRDQVFELLAASDSTRVSILIHSAQFSPFLLAEHLLRIFLKFDKFDPVAILSEESVRTVIINNLLDLQSYSVENECLNLDTVRTIFFLFVQTILWNQHSVDMMFSLPSFSEQFLHFAYEPGYEKIVFDTFRKSLQIMNPEKCMNYSTHIVNFFRKMISSSLKNCINDERYDNIVVKAYESITIGLQYNISITTHFSDLFNLLLSYIDVFPSIHLFLLLFKLFQTFAITEPNWTLSYTDISHLHSQIEKLCGSEPDERIVNALFCCLENSSYLVSIEHLVINYPSILPLLFLIHSKATTKNIQLLQTFNNLCRNSRNNAIAFHTSFVDSLLIQYLCFDSNKGTIFFINKDIEIEIDTEKSVPIIIEILTKVIKSKTDYSIALKLLNLLKITSDKRISTFIIDLLYNGKSHENQMIQLPMDTSQPMVKITGVNWNYIKNCFTIDFYSYIDQMVSKRFRNSYTIFTLTDSNNLFTIQLKNGIIRAYYITPEKTSSAFLFKNISTDNLAHFTIIVSRSTQTKISNFLNNDRISDVSLDLVDINGPITILLGGSDYIQRSVDHPHFGLLLNFRIYPFGLNEDQLQLLSTAPYLFDQDPFFSTEFLTDDNSTSLNYNYTEQTHTYYSSSAIIELDETNVEKDLIIIEKQPPYHIHSHILNFLCNESLFSQILDFQRIELSLDVIHCLFTQSPDIQLNFRDQIPNLFKFVSQNVSYQTYLALFRIMQTIIDNIFKLEWFEMLIINIVLWSQSDEFRIIVHHWNVILKQYKLYFRNKNYFNELLTQFILRFVFDNNSETKHEDIMKTFCTFLVKIARLNFDAQSFDILLSCILICDNEIHLLELARILYEVSTNEVVLNSIDKEKLQLLHKLFQFDNAQLTIYATIALDNMSLRMKDYDPFAICYKIIEHRDLDVIVDHILKEFPQHPNLISFLVVLSIHTNKVSQLVDIIQQHFTSTSLDSFPFTKHNYWYIWAILLYLNVTDEHNEIITTFIAKSIAYLSTQPNDDYKMIDEIFVFLFRVSELNRSFPMIIHVLKNLIRLYEINQKSIPKFVAQYCYTFFFIHSQEFSHHSRPLLEMYRSSLFYDSSYDKPTNSLSKFIKPNRPFNIFDLELFLQEKFSISDVICRVCIDSPSHLSDYYYYKIFDDINPPSTDIFDKNFLQYFINQKTFEGKQNFIYSQIRIFDTFKDKIPRYLIVVFKRIQRGISKLFQDSRKSVSTYDSSNNKHFTHILCTKASTQLQRNTIDLGAHPVIIYKRRSGRLSQLFIPFQLKKKYRTSQIAQENHQLTFDKFSLTNIVTPNKPQENLLFRCNCSVSKFEKMTKHKLKLYDNKICFISEKQKLKIILYDNIKFLFVRKVNDRIGYEIYTNTLRTVLFFVELQHFTSITTYFKTFYFAHLEHSSFSFDPPSTLHEVTKKWQTRQNGNFEYLMYLNMFSGHSFNQFHLYPIMPNILSDFNDLSSCPIDCSQAQRSIIKSPTDTFFDLSIEDNFTKFLDVSSDYFFDFCNNHNSKIKIPSWAKDKFEFIYKNRRKLEELDISTFIDYCFGVKSVSHNSFFIKLFKKEHEKRIPEYISPLHGEMKKLFSDPNSPQKDNAYKHLMREKSIIIKPINENNVYSYELHQKVISVALFKKKNNTIYFSMVFGDNSVACIELIEGVMRARTFYQFDCGLDDMFFSYSARNIYGYSKRKSILYIIQVHKNISEIPLYTEQPLFSSAQDFIFFCSNQCSISKIEKTSHVITKFCSSGSTITRLNASSLYNTLVYATMNGFVYFYEISSAKEINKVDIHDQIVDIIISTNSGFVNIMTDNKIDAFTINGEFISSFNIGMTIKKLFPFYTKEGFDYISFATVTNELGFFDAAYPDKYTIVKKYGSLIQKISFDPREQMFIIILENGYIELLPYSFVV